MIAPTKFCENFKYKKTTATKGSCLKKFKL